MAENQLTTTSSGSGTQTSTESPQASVGSSNQTAEASGIQPGTSTSLLSGSQGGVALHGVPLTVVNLDSKAQTQANVTVPPVKHQNPALYGVSGLLFVVAIAMFWITARSAKNTT